MFYRKESVYAIASRGHVLSASLGVMLLTAAALILTLSTQKSMPSLGHISVGSVVLMGLYTLAMRLIYVNEQRHHQAAAATASSLGNPPINQRSEK